MVGRLLSFWDGKSWGTMFNFQGVIRTNGFEICAEFQVVEMCARPSHRFPQASWPRRTSHKSTKSAKDLKIQNFFQLNPAGWPKLSKAATVENFTAMPSATCTSLVVLGVQKKKSKHSKLQRHWISTNLGGHQKLKMTLTWTLTNT